MYVFIGNIGPAQIGIAILLILLCYTLVIARISRSNISFRRKVFCILLTVIIPVVGLLPAYIIMALSEKKVVQY